MVSGRQFNSDRMREASPFKALTSVGRKCAEETRTRTRSPQLPTSCRPLPFHLRRHRKLCCTSANKASFILHLDKQDTREATTVQATTGVQFATALTPHNSVRPLRGKMHHSTSTTPKTTPKLLIYATRTFYCKLLVEQQKHPKCNTSC